jgi:hypothetical protein
VRCPRAPAALSYDEGDAREGHGGRDASGA